MNRIAPNGLITMNRGDSFSYPLFINVGTLLNPMRYYLGNGEEVFVGITLPGELFENAIIKQRYTKDNLNEKGDVMIELTPKDTEFLVPGNYFFEVKFRGMKNGKEFVRTIVPKKKFVVLE